MRVAVTGAGGRLGRALLAALPGVPEVGEVLAWDLPGHDLDDPDSARRLVTAARPDLVIHVAAWTDVDGCARDPELAMRRNGEATGEMARACTSVGAAMIAISTNEVFDGRRTDGVPYRPEDEPNPINPYGVSKLAGERLAREAFGALDPAFAAASGPHGQRPSSGWNLAIVRTAWLFGGPGPDFPSKILAAAAKVQPGTELSLVADEIGSPTYASDLAAAIAGLVQAVGKDGRHAIGGIHHIVNAGQASRADWGREVLRLAGITIPTRDVPMSTWQRPSTPPAWGVLAPTPLPGGRLRSWRDALAEYLALQTTPQEQPR
jgi:dTDP-4-dehydrorhamnose reductase